MNWAQLCKILRWKNHIVYPEMGLLSQDTIISNRSLKEEIGCKNFCLTVLLRLNCEHLVGCQFVTM